MMSGWLFALNSPSLDGRGVGEVANHLTICRFPLTLALSRKGRGDFLVLCHFLTESMPGQSRYLPSLRISSSTRSRSWGVSTSMESCGVSTTLMR